MKMEYGRYAIRLKNALNKEIVCGKPAFDAANNLYFYGCPKAEEGDGFVILYNVNEYISLEFVDHLLAGDTYGIETHAIIK